MHAFAMNELERFGALLKRHRDERGMTIDAVGARLGRAGTWYWRLETAQNKAYPEPDVLTELTRVLGVSRREMLISLGYISADEPEPEVAYIIREGDPRIAMLRLMDGMPENRVANITRAVALLAGVSGETGRATDGDAHAGTG